MRKESVTAVKELDPVKREGLIVMKLSTLIMDARKDLEPSVGDLIQNHGAYEEKQKSNSETVEHMVILKKEIIKSHGGLSEAILQALLKVDGVNVEEGFESARMKRKEAVRYFHGLLDTIDKIKDDVKK